jgi:hypothetical protein
VTSHRRRRAVIVEVRCAGKRHLLLSVHPDGPRFEVVRAPGRAGGLVRDRDSWLRQGSGTEMSFETLPRLRRSVHGSETGTGAGLLGESPWLFCRCGAAQLSEDVADAIGEAVNTWHEAGQVTTRPATIIVSV